MTNTYDTKCYDLAAAFLEDEPGLFTETHNIALASIIQAAIEDYIEHAKANYEPPDPMEHVEFPFADNH